MYNNQAYDQGYPSAPNQQNPGGNPPPYPFFPPGGYPQENHTTSSYPQPGHPNIYTSQGVYPEAMSGSYAYPGEDPSAAFDFTEKSIRLGFIRKVYSILTTQLLIVVAFVALFLFEKKIQHFVRIHYELLIVAFVLVIALSFVLACCGNVRRKAPLNYICLFLYTISFSFLVGVCAAQYNAKEVMLAMGMTAAITLGLTLFAFQTKIDFTVYGGALLGLLIVLIIGIIFGALFPSRIWQTVIAGFGAFLMSIYIVYDTQLMMGGNHKYALSPEEYVFAALNLYLDIVNLFLYLLQLIGGRD